MGDVPEAGMSVLILMSSHAGKYATVKKTMIGSRPKAKVFAWLANDEEVFGWYSPSEFKVLGGTPEAEPTPDSDPEVDALVLPKEKQ
jgi:hypothetical protein